MSLQVWLPLTEDLENKGFSDFEFTSTVTAGFEQGKIGNALQVKGSNVRFVAEGLTDIDTFSVAFWYKAESDSSITTEFNKVLTFSTKNEDGTSGSLFRFESSYGDRIGSTYSLSVHNNPSQSLGSIGHPIIALKDEWHHVVFTHSPELNSTYLDGELINTGAGAAGTLTGVCIIAAKYSGTDPKGLMNDLRIYDHALSTKEVKEFSKALIAHYPLNDKIGLPNLLPHSRPSSINLSLVGINTNYVSFVTEDKKDCYKFGTGNTTPSSMSQTWKDVVKLEANTTYTYSALIKSNKSSGFYFSSFGHFQVYNSASTATDKTHEDVVAQRVYHPSRIEAGEWTKITITFTTNSLDNSIFRVYPTFNVGSDCIVYIYDQKLEKGSVATPWIPNEADDEYSELGLDEDTIYDCSGYGHDLTSTAGSVSNIEAESDSPRYAVGLNFDKSAKYGASVLIGTSFTLSMWLKLNEFSSNWAGYIRLQHSNKEYIGICDGNAEGKIGAHIYKDVDGSKVAQHDSYVNGWTKGEWFHAAVVVDGKSFKFYKNGVACVSRTMTYDTTEVIRDIYLNSNAGITGYHSISDVRIYATALSDEAVKELYETSASIDQNGNTWAYELVEE